MSYRSTYSIAHIFNVWWSFERNVLSKKSNISSLFCYFIFDKTFLHNFHNLSHKTFMSDFLHSYLVAYCWTCSRILVLTFSLFFEYSSLNSMLRGSSKSQRSVKSEFIPNTTSLIRRVGIQPIPSIELIRRRERQTSPAAKKGQRNHEIIGQKL